MKIFHDIENIPISNPVATMGIFDGVHKAHQLILEKTRQISDSIAGETVVVTLWPHPRVVLNNHKYALHLLNTLDEKIKRMESLKIDYLIILPFDSKMAEMNPVDFVKDILVDKLRIRHLIVGYNHRFGKNREGNYEMLGKLSGMYGFNLEQVDPVYIYDDKVSSSRIRKLLDEGNVVDAAHMLGYEYQITGRVIGGERIGDTIGFPTANLEVSDQDKLIPMEGVYAVKVRFNEKMYIGMMNIGYRPTITNTSQKTLEVHLLNFNGVLYNSDLTIHFFQRIRDEKKFNSLNELKDQLIDDREKILSLLS